MKNENPAPGFEELEKGLNEALARLEDPDAPLEERVKRHREAVRLHGRMDDILVAAGQALAATPSDSDGDPGPDDPPVSEEPYEKILARLTRAVENLEREDLPLARVLELHGEAEALAGRCEAILKSAEGALEELTPGGNGGVASRPDEGLAPF